MYTSLSTKIIRNHRQAICPICGCIEKFLARDLLTIEFDICTPCSCLRANHQRQLEARIFKLSWNQVIQELESWLGVPIWYVTAETVSIRIKLDVSAVEHRLPLERIKTQVF